MDDVTQINRPTITRVGRLSVESAGGEFDHHMSEVTLGEGPAHAIAAAIARGIRSITEAASPATQRRRRGEGRAGPHLFNDTGRLAAGIDAVASGDEWRVAPPPDRLTGDPSTVGRLVERLRELVPALRQPLDEPAVRRAIEQTLTSMIRSR
jgi:hypothetical protein